MLSPFQQAKRYAAELPYSQRPRWIITCNFAEFNIYDMEKPNGEPEIIYTTVQPRSIPVAIILSIVTCGIYALYWMYSINNEINDLAQDPMAASGGVVILLTLVTCGVYGWYWNYKMGEKCDFITQKNSSSGVIFLILSIFGLGLVSLCLMQDTVNRVLQ